MIDFAIARRAALTQKRELERLFKVSYPMVNAYMKDKSYPRGARRVYIEKVLAHVSKLLAEGTLPFSADMDSEDRLKAIDEIVTTVTTAQA